MSLNIDVDSSTETTTIKSIPFPSAAPPSSPISSVCGDDSDPESSSESVIESPTESLSESIQHSSNSFSPMSASMNVEIENNNMDELDHTAADVVIPAHDTLQIVSPTGSPRDPSAMIASGHLSLPFQSKEGMNVSRPMPALPPTNPVSSKDDISEDIVGGDEEKTIKYTPLVVETTPEDESFLLPEDELFVRVLERTNPISELPVRMDSLPPSRLLTAYEEFSRNYVIATVAEDSPVELPLSKGDFSVPASQAPQNVLQSLVTSVKHTESNFRQGPRAEEWESLSSELIKNDLHLLFRMSGLRFKRPTPAINLFEPIFASAFLCILVPSSNVTVPSSGGGLLAGGGNTSSSGIYPGELVRISETFHFDLTPDSVRSSYASCYAPQSCEVSRNSGGASPSKVTMPSPSRKNGSSSQGGSRVVPNSPFVADGSNSSNAHLKMVLARLPVPVLSQQEVYLVVNIDKFLTSDNSKAIAPYLRGASAPTLLKPDSVERLASFRQPLGIAVIALPMAITSLSESKRSANAPMKDYRVTVFQQKVVMTDDQIAGVIRDSAQDPSSSAYARLEPLDLELSVNVFSLGTPSDMSIVETPVNFRQALSGGTSTSHTPVLITSQVSDEKCPIRHSNTCGLKVSQSPVMNLSSSTGNCAVRCVMPVIIGQTGSSLPEIDSLRHLLSTSVEHTLLVNLLSVQGLHQRYRNLSVRVELYDNDPITSEQRRLAAIYNHRSVSGPCFVEAAHSRVSYHRPNSPMNDEIKIRLPEVIHNNHILKFTILHLHVKPPNRRKTVFNSLKRAPIDLESDTETTEVASGSLRLMSHQALLVNKKHTLEVVLQSHIQREVGEKPTITFRTHIASSLMSTDPPIQTFLSSAPPPLGYLPSGTLGMNVVAKLVAVGQMKRSSLKGYDTQLIKCLRGLVGSSATPGVNTRQGTSRSNPPIVSYSARQLRQHWLVIMRLLLRILQGGSGMFSLENADPFQRHNSVRCAAFRTFLDFLSDTIKTQSERDILDSYISFIHDEYLPLSSSLLDEAFVDAGYFNATSSHLSAQVSAQMSGEDILTSGEGTGLPGLNRQLSDCGLSATDASIRSDAEDDIGATNIGSNSLLRGDSLIEEEEEDFDESESDIEESVDDGYDPDSSRPCSMRISASSIRDLDLTITPSGAISLEDVGVELTTVAEGDETCSAASGDELAPLPGINRRLSICMRDLPEQVCRASVKHNVQRQSWGNFITDALWISGRLSDISSLKNPSATQSSMATSDTEVGDFSSSYLDDILEHLVSQSLRVVCEELVITTMNSELESMSTATLISTCDSLLRLDISARHHVPFGEKQGTSDSTSITNGSTTGGNSRLDSGDLFINGDSVKERLSRRSTYVAEPVAIEPSGPRYDTLSGPSERLPDLPASTDPSKPVTSDMLASHWWPWLYEVLAIEMLSLLESRSQSCATCEATVGTPGKPSTDTPARVISLLNHTPALLKFLVKSISLRITREHKRSPVLLDNQTLDILRRLVSALFLEALHKDHIAASGTTRSSAVTANVEALVESLATFLRSLYAYIAPIQVLTLIRAAVQCNIPATRKSDALPLQLLMLDALGSFDHIVAVNYPHTLDAPVDNFSFNLQSDVSGNSTLKIETVQEHQVSFTPAGLRALHTPPSYALAHLLVGSLLRCSKDSRYSLAAWSSIASMLARNAYDARYQSREAQQRIACMYLPLIHYIIQESSLSTPAVKGSATSGQTPPVPAIGQDDVQRFMYGILMYLLNAVPSRVMRHQIRQYTANSLRLQHQRTQGASGIIRANSDGFTTITSSKNNTNIVGISEAYLQSPSDMSGDELASLCASLHNLLDVFPCHPSVPVSMEPLADIGGENPLDESLSPNPQVEITRKLMHLENYTRGSEAMRSGKKNVPTKIKVDALPPATSNRYLAPSTTSVVLSLLWMLLDEIPGELRRFEDSLDVSGQSELDTASTSGATVGTGLGGTSDTNGFGGRSQAAGSPHNGTFVLRAANLTEAMVGDISSFRLVGLLRRTLVVLLHALSTHQTDANTVAELFLCAHASISQFGAKVFCAAVEDGLQYWMRVTIFHLATTITVIREAASNFLLCLLRAVFNAMGSFSLISQTLMAVLEDSIWEILACHDISIEAEEVASHPIYALRMSLEAIRLAATEKRAELAARKLPKMSYCAAVVTLMDSLLLILRAHRLLRRLVPCPAGYDFYGGNTLDIEKIGEKSSSNIGGSASSTGGHSATGVNVNTSSGGVTSNGGSTTTGSGATSNTGSATGGTSADSGGLNSEAVRLPKLVDASPLEIEAAMEIFSAAAATFHAMQLPRHRIKWLEDICRLADRSTTIPGSGPPRHLAEQAEARWQIFEICRDVEHCWSNLWVPRPPLFFRKGKNMKGRTWEIFSNLSSRRVPSSLISSVSYGKNSTPTAVTAANGFFALFSSAVDAPPGRPWVDVKQYWQHIESTLFSASRLYAQANLCPLFERTTQTLLNVYRLQNRMDFLFRELQHLHTILTTKANEGASPLLGLGTFYRIEYTGKGMCEHLVGRSFVMRSATRMMVADFQGQIHADLRQQLDTTPEGKSVEVRFVQSMPSEADLSNPSLAIVLMNTLRPVLPRHRVCDHRLITIPETLPEQRLRRLSTAPCALSVLNSTSFLNNSVGSHSSCSLSQTTCASRSKSSFAEVNVEDFSRTRCFQYSLVFTREGRTHAKSMDQQWMRVITVTVPHPFPYILSRQPILHSFERIATPIEAARDIIEGRVEEMEAMLDIPILPNEGSRQVMMRLIQGTVLPQVNSGAGTVATLFLSRANIQATELGFTESMAALRDDPLLAQDESLRVQKLNAITAERSAYRENIVKLKVSLINFLFFSRLLLLKSRRIFYTDAQSTEISLLLADFHSRTVLSPPTIAPSTGNHRHSVGGSGSDSSATSADNIRWQAEMQKGYDTMFRTIFPHVEDIPQARILKQ